jgi:hypothetical protein
MLKPYMGYCGDPADGAVLIFAESHAQAKTVGYPDVSGWTGCVYKDMRVKRLREYHDYLMSLCKKDTPHCIDDVPSCARCELWGAPMNADGFGCGLCGGDE